MKSDEKNGKRRNRTSGNQTKLIIIIEDGQ